MWWGRQFLIAIEACTQLLVLRSITDRTISVDRDCNPLFAFVPSFAIWASYRATIPCISIYTVSKTTSDVCPAGLQIAAQLCSWRYWRSERARSRCSAACVTLSDQFTILPDFNLSLLALNQQPWGVLLLSLFAYWNDSLRNWLLKATTQLSWRPHHLLIQKVYWLASIVSWWLYCRRFYWRNPRWWRLQCRWLLHLQILHLIIFWFLDHGKTFPLYWSHVVMVISIQCCKFVFNSV